MILGQICMHRYLYKVVSFIWPISFVTSVEFIIASKFANSASSLHPRYCREIVTVCTRCQTAFNCSGNTTGTSLVSVRYMLKYRPCKKWSFKLRTKFLDAPIPKATTIYKYAKMFRTTCSILDSERTSRRHTLSEDNLEENGATLETPPRKWSVRLAQQTVVSTPTALAHALPSYNFKIHINIILLCTIRSSK